MTMILGGSGGREREFQGSWRRRWRPVVSSVAVGIAGEEDGLDCHFPEVQAPSCILERLSDCFEVSIILGINWKFGSKDLFGRMIIGNSEIRAYLLC
ncbi:hypothetical protein LINPERPRIM_LOCUS14711 [Linum perenne]